MKNISSLALVLCLLVANSSFAQSASDQNKLALQLIKKMPASGYINRQLCIRDGLVYGTYGIQSWAVSGLSVGTLSDFPKSSTQITAKMKVPFSIEYPKGPQDWGRFQLLEGKQENGFFRSSGVVGSKPADICVFESKPVLE